MNTSGSVLLADILRQRDSLLQRSANPESFRVEQAGGMFRWYQANNTWTDWFSLEDEKALHALSEAILDAFKRLGEEPDAFV